MNAQPSRFRPPRASSAPRRFNRFERMTSEPPTLYLASQRRFSSQAQARDLDAQTPSPQGEAIFGEGRERKSSAGYLLYGDEFLREIRSLQENGIQDLGTRHDAALKVCWYLGHRRVATSGDHGSDRGVAGGARSRLGDSK